MDDHVADIETICRQHEYSSAFTRFVYHKYKSPGVPGFMIMAGNFSGQNA